MTRRLTLTRTLTLTLTSTPTPTPTPDPNPNPHPNLSPTPTPNQAPGACRQFADPVHLRLGGGELGGEELDRGTLDEYTEYLRRGGSTGLGSAALNRARKKAGLGPL